MLDRIDRLMIATSDPNHVIEGRAVPIGTVLLYRVCDGNDQKMDEVNRALRLYAEKLLTTHPSEAMISAVQKAIGVNHDLAEIAIIEAFRAMLEEQ